MPAALQPDAAQHFDEIDLASLVPVTKHGSLIWDRLSDAQKRERQWSGAKAGLVAGLSALVIVFLAAGAGYVVWYFLLDRIRELRRAVSDKG